MGSLSGAGRLFHNIGPPNLIDRFPDVDCTKDTCKLLQFRVTLTQGSVTTHLKCCGTFIDNIITNLRVILTVKKFEN